MRHAACPEGRTATRPHALRAAFAALCLLGAAGLGAASSRRDGDGAREEVATRRALAYLAGEVPKWSRENGCFSCHNNGDAARALFLDAQTPLESLRDTLAWLLRPQDWTKAEAPFRDDRLARLQFTIALEAATDAKRLADRDALARACATMAADQAPDGSWPIEDAAPVGSPATYGRALATALARKALSEVDARRFAAEIARADRWLDGRAIANVPDAAALLIARPEHDESRRKAVALLRRAQNDDGGWGPYPRSPTEPFDSALALIALDAARDREDVTGVIRRGRRSLAASQEEDGSWPATTRPAGGLSYAQKVSTTGWAAIALQVTRDRVKADAPGP